MSGRTIDKLAVARNFSSAAARYEDAATAQNTIARRLVEKLPPSITPRFVVDLGCGTGMLSSLLLARWPDAELVGIDLAQGMIEACRRRCTDSRRAHFVVGDAEAAEHLQREADMVVSSCAVQWFADPAATLQRWIDAMASGGVLACALLLGGSFIELETAYRRAVGSSFPGLTLWNADATAGFAANAGLDVICCDQETVVTQHRSARAALRSFRQIGATMHGQPGYARLGFVAMQRLLAAYERDATVTCRVEYLVGRKVDGRSDHDGSRPNCTSRR